MRRPRTQRLLLQRLVLAQRGLAFEILVRLRGRLLALARLVRRLRDTFPRDDGAQPVLTRRTGWRLLWDVRRSKVVVTEADGASWEQKVGELPPNVQDIIARGGLEKWVKAQIEA